MDIKRRSSTTNTKTIKTPGSSIERVAQACDRCRAKKTKCDGKKPTCSSCAAIGIQCIVSDRLSRRAFPKGYTETLEERIRQLEAENRRLVGLVDLRDEQLEMANGKGGKGSFNDSLTSSNLSRLQKKLHEDGCPCGCADHPHSLHDRPVSVIGSVHEGGRELASSVNFSDDNDSLVSATDSLAGIRDDLLVSSHTKPLTFGASSEEVDPAPGAFAAATAIAKMQTKHELQNKQQMLTSLVAMSVPRLTEETLFIPTLLAKVCQAYGYNLKPAILAANSLALLKEAPERTPKSKIKDLDVLHKLLMDREDVIRLKDDEASYFITHLLHLPHSRIDLDKLIMVYFSEWGNILPVIDKQTFLKQYDTWVSYLEQGFVVSGNNPPALYDLVEKFGAIIVLVVSLSMLSLGEDEVNVGDSDFNVKSHQLEYFDHLIHEFVRPNCIISRYCSVQSLQILTLALQYCLAIGDLTTCYELRGRAISMAQQLRLHRCPAAVLGISSSTESANIRNFRQGERRILFWCIYCLDVYSSLNLGVPRLLKDFEVECAMPFSGDRDDDDVLESVLVVNNTRLAIVGKVSKLALSYMRYCKVLAGILDAIFSRFDASDFQNEALARDGILESWRRELPSDLKFEIDTNGFSKPSSELSKLSRNQLVLMFLYYHAKILIYLPLISQYGDHHDVMLSAKEKISRDSALQRHSEGKYVPIRPRRKENSEDLRDGLVHEDLKYENLKHEDLENETLHSASETLMKGGAMIQQLSIQLLECLHALSTEGVNSKVGAVGLPIPLNVSREMARYTLLVAQGSLDYIRGGTLFQHLKQLLLDCLSHMVAESNSYLPGRMKKSSIKLMDLAVLTILDLNVTKAVKKKSPAPARQPVLRPAVDRRGPTSQLANEVINSSSLNGNEPNNQKDTHISRQVSPRQFTPIESKRQTSIKTEVPMNISPTNDNLMNLINDNTNNASNVEYDNYAFDNDNIEDILMFDPFKVDFQGMPDEFVTDGSLGLVPFLDNNGSRGFSFDDSLSQRP